MGILDQNAEMVARHRSGIIHRPCGAGDIGSPYRRERGTSFGYNTLVSDLRGLPIMARSGNPVVFDATHSVQQPGGQGTSSGGKREFAPILARAAWSIGVAAVFIECREDPERAPSNGPNMIRLAEMPALLARLKAFDALAKAG